MNDFNSNNFAVQVIASGSFADQPVYADKTYLVETVTIRLNPVALNAWLDTVAYPLSSVLAHVPGVPQSAKEKIPSPPTDWRDCALTV